MKKLTVGFADIFQRDMELHAQKLMENYGVESMSFKVQSSISETEGTMKINYSLGESKKSKKAAKKAAKKENKKSDKKDKKEDKKLSSPLLKDAEKLGLRKRVLTETIVVDNCPYVLKDINLKLNTPLKFLDLKSNKMVWHKLPFLSQDGKFLTKKGEKLVKEMESQ